MDRSGSNDGAMPARASLAARPLIAVVRLYQAIGRPLVGGHCRFHPTCSDYAVEALTKRGALAGGWLTLRRLARCHPFGGAGYDPVPERPCRGHEAREA